MNISPQKQLSFELFEFKNEQGKKSFLLSEVIYEKYINFKINETK